MSILMLMAACASPPTEPMAECPTSPNCVSSLTKPSDTEHLVQPLHLSSESDWARLNEVISSMPRVKLITDQPNYKHYTFKTALLRFTDDVELRRDSDHFVHIRSASRVGHSDLGVNRRRVEAIRAALSSKL